MSNAKILVVDDELSIRLFLEETLTNDGHQVTTIENGKKALALISRQTFDLALLDLMLGDISGMEVLATLRQQSPHTVVIILTAHGTLETAVEALRQGAHDYLFKPCKTVQLRESIRQGLLKRQRELRQRSLLRQLEERLTLELEDIRATIATDRPELTSTLSTAALVTSPLDNPEPELIGERFLQQGSLIVDVSQHVITLDGHLLELSPTEFDVLAYLVSEAPRVISAQELVREVHGYTSEIWEARDTVRQHIYNIRHKLKKVTGRTDIIRTVRGVGYTVKE